MYSKNAILLFCVALYFLQCRGTPPTQEQYETTKNIIEAYENPYGTDVEENGDRTINLKGLKDIFVKVAQRMNIRKEPPSLEQLQTTGLNYKYTLVEVQRYVAKYLGYAELSQGLSAWVRLLYCMYEKPVINYPELKDLLSQIQVSNPNRTAEFPYLEESKTAIPYKWENSISEHVKFTRNEVEFIVIGYYFPK
ncbi:uncharacterized protein LOC126839883 [Adelges cooleyi]|uniref:uncharacterized protein LOC126839883 n=1 Tax=Adelges cooleyi TaxID=133065 RepID=UPI002180810B|nr:uncharacterized protein LOC126839883 [Adelges cooleyi]